MKKNLSMQIDPRDHDAIASLVSSGDYILTIAEIGETLGVSRGFIEKNIKQNVKNVWISKNTKKDLKDYYGIEIQGMTLRFSKRDLYRWFNENLVVSRQTIELNMFKYVSDPKAFKKEMDDFRRRAYMSVRVRSEKKMIFEKYATPLGHKILDSEVSYMKRKAVEPTILDQEIDPFSEKVVRPREIDQVSEVAYRYAFKHGLVKGILCDEVTYFLNDVTLPQGVFYGVTISYQDYRRIEKNVIK